MEIVLCVVLAIIGNVAGGKHTFVTDFRNAFDKELYASLLDEEKCFQQLEILRNHSLGLKFLDATGKFSSGILEGNYHALGDFFECLAINQVIERVDIQGKYCSLKIPLKQDMLASSQSPVWSDLASQFGLSGLFPIEYYVDLLKEAYEDSFNKVKSYFVDITGFGKKYNESELDKSSLLFTINMGVCIPHTCTTKQVIDYVGEKYAPLLNLTYKEYFCRLTNDKPFTAAEYTAIVVFSILGILTLVSTSYDVYKAVILKKDQSQINKVYRCFSVYTNTRRLLTFNQEPGTLDCVDGIRTLSMLWVIVSHVYTSKGLEGIHNRKYLLEWIRFFTSTWLSSASITVDTFFLLSGMLSVYTTVKKYNRGSFVRNIHFFYILRLLRMFPLLAATVLLQASFFHHASDGPYWEQVAENTEFCRKFWWTTLLHIQNIVNPIETCVGATWYLAVDVQLYILSPLVIMWMFGKELLAWIALAVTVVMSLIASTYYSFTYNLSAVIGNPARYSQHHDYMTHYYTNTLARASPFFVGMAFGYLMHLYRNKKLTISKVNIALLWMLSTLMMTFSVVSVYPVMQKGYDLQVYDNILNSYMRFIWACGLGMIIFACVKGYGGPINWFLSLHMWKIPARMSYGVYLLHMPLILIIQGSWAKNQYFSMHDETSRFMAFTTTSFILSFFMTIFIDSPFSTLQKIFLTGKARPQAALASKPDPERLGEPQYYKTRL